MIEIQDLEGLDSKEIVNLLLDVGKQPFDIYIPKVNDYILVNGRQ